MTERRNGRETERVSKQANRDFYDGLKSERQRFNTSSSKIHGTEVLVPWISGWLNEGDLVLDVAGGAGTYASEIRRLSGANVVGIDLSFEMIRQRVLDPSLTQNAVGDMEALPFHPESFDVVMFVACLHHLKDATTALNEAFRVMRPGGKVFAWEPCSLRAGRSGASSTHLDHEFRISLPWLRRLFSLAGFMERDVKTRRIAMRLLPVKQPSVPMFRVGDRVDRLLSCVPWVRHAGSVGMLMAEKPVLGRIAGNGRPRLGPGTEPRLDS